MPEGASPASFSVVERRTAAHRRSSAPIGDPTLITPSPALLVLEISPGDPPNLVKPAGPLRPWIRDLSFPWSAPGRAPAGGWRGWIPTAEQERGAREALARPCGECLPRGGGGRDAGAPIGRCFVETAAGGARGGAAARFHGLPPVQLYPLKTWPPRGEASRAAAARPAARVYRWPPHGLTEGA